MNTETESEYDEYEEYKRDCQREEYKNILSSLETIKKALSYFIDNRQNVLGYSTIQCMGAARKGINRAIEETMKAARAKDDGFEEFLKLAAAEELNQEPVLKQEPIPESYKKSSASRVFIQRCPGSGFPVLYPMTEDGDERESGVCCSCGKIVEIKSGSKITAEEHDCSKDSGSSG
jgi:hypothetical protein